MDSVLDQKQIKIIANTESRRNWRV